MLIIALVLAVIALAALVTAIVTSNELIAWVCIAASVIGVLLLIVDALRERSREGESEEIADSGEDEADDAEVHADEDEAEDYPEGEAESEGESVESEHAAAEDDSADEKAGADKGEPD